jgi:nucleotide-binding universal stress UspA family protein
VPSAAVKRDLDTANQKGECLAKAELLQDVLVYQDAGSASRRALEYAQALARASDGNVTALMMTVFNLYGMGYPAEASAAAWKAARDQAVREADLLEAHLKERLSKLAPEAELRKVDIFGGEGPDRLAEFGRYADAVILGWSVGVDDDWQQKLFNQSLFHSGRPVIVVPEEFKQHGVPRRIMVAWSPSEEATRALHEAMPLLRNAEAVSVVVVDNFDTQWEKGHPGVDIGRHLARHDVKAEVKHVPPGNLGVTHTLLDESRYFGADLVVLGGYGHSRLSEWMLGGVTREMLETCRIPMLFSH